MRSKTTVAPSTLLAKRRTLERQLAGVLAAASSCDLTQALQAKINRAREQLLTFLDHPGRVAATNNACERALRPAVVQRKSLSSRRRGSPTDTAPCGLLKARPRSAPPSTPPF
jgi:transposase